MSNLTLTCKETSDFKPHPEGIHPALCVDVMDLGLVETDFQGQRRMVNKVKLVFESEQLTEEGKRCTVSKNFTASLHPKAKLAEFLGKWRGRPVMPGETIDLSRLLGASCTLVISHQQNLSGKTYASIDAVAKPTKKLAASGHYDPVAARQRYAEWSSRPAGAQQHGENGRSPMANSQWGSGGNQQATVGPQHSTANVQQPTPNIQPGGSSTPLPSPLPVRGGEGAKSAAVSPAPAFDPEVGF